SPVPATSPPNTRLDGVALARLQLLAGRSARPEPCGRRTLCRRHLWRSRQYPAYRCLSSLRCGHSLRSRADRRSEGTALDQRKQSRGQALCRYLLGTDILLLWIRANAHRFGPTELVAKILGVAPLSSAPRRAPPTVDSQSGGDRRP